MAKDIKKSVSRLSEIVMELQKSESKNGHATVQGVMRSTKPIEAAKPPQMPLAKNWTDASGVIHDTASGYPVPGQSKTHPVKPKIAKPKGGFKDYDPTRPPKGMKLSPEDRDRIAYEGFSKANIPVAKHALPVPKKTQPIRHIPAKDKAYMKVQKAIVLMQKEMQPSSFTPVSDNVIRKSFGSIPEIMKDVTNRPSDAWWDRCFNRAQNFSEQPANYLGRVWYGDVAKEAPWCEMKYNGTKEAIKGEPNQGEDADSEALKKWIPAALEGGGFSSLRQHPRAGNAIKNCAINVGKAILGKSSSIIKSGVGDIDPEQIGYAVLEALDEIANDSEDEKLSKAWSNALGGLVSKQWQAVIPAVAGAVGDDLMEPSEDANKARPFTPLMQKAVAEPIDSKNSPKKRKARLGEEFDGESAVSGDGTKLNVDDMAEKGKSKTTQDY